MVTVLLLLIEDDHALAQQVREQLEQDGHRVRWLANGDDALAEDPSPYALVILDLMLPGAGGLSILKSYRERSDTPILVLSAKQDAAIKVKALQLGADDYVTKPFWPEELAARIAARMRRPVLQREGVVELGELAIDLVQHAVRVRGEEVALTRVEFEVLASLARRGGGAVEREVLAEEALDPERDGTGRTLDVHVSRLRKKLGDCGASIRTIWGVGYRLEVAEA